MRTYKDKSGNKLDEGYKYCPDCDEVYTVDSFYSYEKNGGKTYYFRRCKLCHNNRGKAWWEENQYGKKYYSKNKEEVKLKKRIDRKTEAGKRAKKKQNKRYWDKPENAIKHIARGAVSTAIKKGTLVKPDKCELCKRNSTLEAHHVDYKKPLDVMWLCILCHTKWHKHNKTEQEKGED